MDNYFISVLLYKTLNVYTEKQDYRGEVMGADEHFT